MDFRAVTVAGRYENFERALERVVRAEVGALVAAQRASIEIADETSSGGPSRVISVRPARDDACPVTVCAQSDNEVSLFVGPPDDPASMTVDLVDNNEAALLDLVRGYLAAVLAGRIEVESRPRSSSGRVTFLLADGAQASHGYNHLLWRPRLRPWTVSHFEPY